MMKNLVALSTILLFSTTVLGEDIFKYLGTFDDVRATETGHCYDTSISIWQTNNEKVIGLLDVHSGLCGDPPCSFMEGKINNYSKISIKAHEPINGKLYLFDGTVTRSKLTGQLNKSNTELKSSKFQFTSKDKQQWCSTWTKVPRCHGVKQYCR